MNICANIKQKGQTSITMKIYFSNSSQLTEEANKILRWTAIYKKWKPNVKTTERVQENLVLIISTKSLNRELTNYLLIRFHAIISKAIQVSVQNRSQILRTIFFVCFYQYQMTKHLISTQNEHKPISYFCFLLIPFLINLLPPPKSKF